jgi:hypothetical protein
MFWISGSQLTCLRHNVSGVRLFSILEVHSAVESDRLRKLNLSSSDSLKSDNAFVGLERDKEILTDYWEYRLD